jgi:hypothetical protein
MTVEPEKGAPRRPLWVWVCVGGLPSRGSALACVWFSLGLGLAAAVVGFWDRRAWIGTVFLLGACWYSRAIRWVDRHGSWK